MNCLIDDKNVLLVTMFVNFAKDLLGTTNCYDFGPRIHPVQLNCKDFAPKVSL